MLVVVTDSISPQLWMFGVEDQVVFNFLAIEQDVICIQALRVFL